MNLLIVGGLLGIALLAILGVVLLSIGEQGDRRKAALTQSQAAVPSASPAPVAPAAPAAAVSSTLLPDVRAALPTATIPLPPLEEHDGNGSGRLHETFSSTVQSGQLYELMEELHELRQQAGQIESRLGLLSEMLNNMQHERYQEAVALGE